MRKYCSSIALCSFVLVLAYTSIAAAGGFGGGSGGGGGGSGDALTTTGLSQFAATPSSGLAGVLNDETGFNTGAKSVFSIYPSITGGAQVYCVSTAGVCIGDSAGGSNTGDAINIGFFAGNAFTGTTAGAVHLGRHAGYAAAGDNAVAVGHASSQYAFDSASSVAIGYQAARNPTQAAGHHSFSSVIIGNLAGTNATNSQTSTMVGNGAGESATNAVGAVLLGYNAGNASTNATNSIFIGNSAGSTLSRSNTLCIEGNSSYAPNCSAGAMIYGELDNRVLKLNGLTLTASTGTLTIPNSASLILSGAFGLTLTSTATTNSTFPAGTHTLAGLDVNQTWSGTQTYGSSVLVATSPKVVTSILDTNGNTWVSTTATASAVDYFDISNGATTNSASSGAPSLTAAGSDTNVGLRFKTKGTGVYFFSTGTTAGDVVQINSTGTLSGATNASGTRFQLVTADASLRLPSDGYIGFNSGTNLGSGAITTTLCQSTSGVLSVNAGTGCGTGGKFRGAHQSSDGTDGATVTSCTAFKNGLCVAGT